MEKQETPKPRQFSRKRFIPMATMFLIGIVMIFSRLSPSFTMRFAVECLNSRPRTAIIYLAAFIIGACHFFYIGRNDEKHKDGILRFGTGLFASLGGCVGSGFLIDKSLNLAVGLMKDYLGISFFFVDHNNVDYFPITLVVLLIIFFSGYNLWKKSEECMFEASHNLVKVEPEKAPDQKEGSKGEDNCKLVQ